MPCYDGRAEHDANITMRLACMYCSELEEQMEPIPVWARGWWKEHVEWDRKHGRNHPEINDKEKR